MLRALLDPATSPYDRIKAAHFALGFAEGWYMDLRARYAREKRAGQNPTAVALQFITGNAFAGLRMNVNGLVAYTYTLVSSPTLRQLPYAPFFLLNSQEAEHRFRDFRAVAGIENFTFAEILRRSNLHEAHAILKAKHAHDFRYPQSHKAWNFDEMPDSAPPLPAEFRVTDIITAAAAGYDEARECLATCGISVKMKPEVAMPYYEPSDDLDDEDVDDEMHNIEWECDEEVWAHVVCLSLCLAIVQAVAMLAKVAGVQGVAPPAPVALRVVRMSSYFKSLISANYRAKRVVLVSPSFRQLPLRSQTRAVKTVQSTFIRRSHLMITSAPSLSPR
jgi:hypothetical protein